MRVLLSIAVFLMTSACGPMQALTREYYNPPIDSKSPAFATVTGYDTAIAGNAKPVRAFVGGIDGKPVSLAKPARCNFDKKYGLTAGKHLVGVSVTIGPSYTDSLVGYAELPLTAEPGKNYIVKAEFRSEAKAAAWIVEASTGTDVTTRTEIVLKDSPQKGSPIGFAAIANSCSMP